MIDKVFIDTNIWIYFLIKSKKEAESIKRQKILSFFENLNSHVVISTQVLNEVHWNFIKKFKLDDNTAFELINKGIIKITDFIEPIKLETYKRAYNLRKNYNFSFWDSLIVASALENNCKILFSEDMQNNLWIENRMKIKNPLSEVKIYEI